MSKCSDPPSAPRNVLADDVTKSSCKLSWEPPETDNGSPVIGYLVERCEGKSTRWTKVNKDPINERQLYVSDLLAGESYQFRVSAVNAAGNSCFHTKLYVLSEIKRTKPKFPGL